MARRRMFSLDVVDSDQFIDLPITTRLLYYELGMQADDDGFVGNPKKVTKFADCTEEDIKILVDKGFVYLFDSGPVVIRHWLANNQLRNDRYHETYFKNEKSMIGVNLKNKTYYLFNDDGLPDGLPLVALDEIRRKKNSEEEINEDEFNLSENRKNVTVLSDNDVLVKDIIDYLNNKINTSYNWDKTDIRKLINNWVEKGYKKLDFQIVIDKKYDEWKDSKMRVYLTPYTLFGEKFENYYNQPVKKKSLEDIPLQAIERMIKEEKQVGISDEDDSFDFY